MPYWLIIRTIISKFEVIFCAWVENNFVNAVIQFNWAKEISYGTNV